MLEPSAIQFCARKVAAVAGDMRRALDICRRAIETVETSVRLKSVLQPTGKPLVFLHQTCNLLTPPIQFSVE